MGTPARETGAHSLYQAANRTLYSIQPETFQGIDVQISFLHP